MRHTEVEDLTPEQYEEAKALFMLTQEQLHHYLKLYVAPINLDEAQSDLLDVVAELVDRAVAIGLTNGEDSE